MGIRSINCASRGIAWLLGALLLQFAAPQALGQNVTLSHVFSVGVKTATLTISGHTDAWWHKSDQTNATCVSVAANTSSSDLTNLTGGTTYVFKAYSDSSCTSELASTTFTTIAVTIDQITSTTARLNLANNTHRTWSYKQTSPSGPACQQDFLWPFDPDDSPQSLTGLSPSTSYTFTVYWSGDCTAANEADAVSFSTSAATLAVSNITKTTATLTISGHSNIAWWYQGSQSGATCESVAASTSTANLAKLTVGTEHTYKAYNASGCAAANEIASRTFTTLASPPGAPSNLKATKTWRAASLPPNPVQYPAAVRVRFSWTSGAANGATITGTDLRYRQTSPVGSWQMQRNAHITELTLTFASSTANFGKAMEFQVKDDNSKGAGAWSASSAFTVALAPAKPAAPSVTVGYKQLGLSWTAPNSRGAAVTGYDVQYRQGNSGSWSNHTHSGTGTTATVTGLDHIAAYQFRIRATNSQGDSEWSNTVSATTRSGKVKDVRAVGGAASLDVSWTAQAGATSYKIQWKSGSQGWDATNRQATSTAASKTLTTLTNGTDYVVRVAAVFSGGTAAWSDAAAGKPTATPSALKASAVTSTGATLTLTGHTGNWWVKGVGGGGYSLSCTQAAGASHSLLSLSGNRSYEFAAYSDSACSEANKLGAAGFAMPGSILLAVHNVGTHLAYVELHGQKGQANWSHRIDKLGDGNVGPCRNHRRGSSVTVSLQPGTTYTAHAYNSLSCAALERLGSVTFTTLSEDASQPRLSVSNIGNNGATLSLANHSGDWYYDRGRDASTCVKAPKGVSSVTVSGLQQNTNYSYTAYSDPRCSAANESIEWESMTTFTTTGSVAITVRDKTSTGFTVKLSGYTEANGYPDRWAVKAVRKRNDGGWEGSTCQVLPRATTSAAITGLKPGLTYTVNVYKKGTCNFHSDVISETATTTSLSANAGVTSATLTLEHHEGSWSYRGGQAAGASAASAVGQCHAVPDGTWTTQITGLNANTSYVYTAQAGGNCAGAALGQTRFTTQAAASPPETPASVTVTRADGVLNASWRAVEDATSYHVTYTDNGGASWNLAALNHSTNSIAIGGVDNAKTYVVGVRARNAAGDSGWRNSPSAGPFAPDPVEPPETPASVTVTRADGVLNASWRAVEGATSYHVTYTDNGGASWNLAALNHSTNSIAIGGVDNAKTYIVGVRAGNDHGWSGWRNSAPAAPHAPEADARTDALLSDLDGDGVGDVFEELRGTDPLDPDSVDRSAADSDVRVLALEAAGKPGLESMGDRNFGIEAMAEPGVEVNARLSLGAFSGDGAAGELAPGDVLDILAEVEPDARHAGLPGAFHLLFRDGTGRISQLGVGGEVASYDGTPEGLVPLRISDPLAPVERFLVVRGLVVEAGLGGSSLDLFLAYRAGGELVYAAEPLRLRFAD